MTYRHTHPTLAPLKRMTLTVLIMLGTLTASAQDGPRRYWSDTWRGWHFYEDPSPDVEAKPATSPKALTPAVPTLPPKAPELAAFERLQKAVEETRNIAIMQPTEANVRRYMELESQVVERASYFADVAQRVAWATPELDPTLQGRPVGAKALEVFEQQQLADRSRSIADLGRDHVLFFFYRADCPYCHAFAPTLEAFQVRHGIKVVAIISREHSDASTSKREDGKKLQDFSDIVIDTGAPVEEGEVEPCLLEDAVQRTRCQVVTGMACDGDQPENQQEVFGFEGEGKHEEDHHAQAIL